MYKPIENPRFLLHDDGPNSFLDHQLVISKLTTELGVLYYHQKTLTLVPLPETPLGEGPGHQVPDVLLFDGEAQETRVIIEVTHPRTVKRDLAKVIHLIEYDDYGIEEGFVYNYHTNEWLRYRKGDGELATASSFSEVMNIDLGAFLLELATRVSENNGPVLVDKNPVVEN